MTSYTGVVVGTDGSPTAARAVRAAAAVARALDARLTIVTAFQRGMFDDPPPGLSAKYPNGIDPGTEASWALDVSVDAAAELRGQGLDARQTTVPLAPAAALDEIAGDRPGSLIVVGTRGLSERAERLVGNVPHELTHHAHADLLLVTTAEDENTHDWKHVGLATDGSDTAIMACRTGLALAEALGADVTMVSAAPDDATANEALDATAAALGDAQLARQVIVTSGDFGRAVAEAGAQYDLLVLGNRGMSGIRRLLGSVPNTVTHKVPTDLLLVNTSRGPA